MAQILTPGREEGKRVNGLLNLETHNSGPELFQSGQIVSRVSKRMGMRTNDDYNTNLLLA